MYKLNSPHWRNDQDMPKHQAASLTRELFDIGYEAEMWKGGSANSDVDHGLRETHEFVKALLSTSHMPFVYAHRGPGMRANYPIGRIAPPQHWSLSEQFLSHVEVNPPVRAFAQICAMLKVPEQFWLQPHNMLPGRHRPMGETFNEAVRLLRTRFSKSEFDSHVRTRGAAASRDFQSACSLIEKIGSRSRPLVVQRFDLLYGQGERDVLTANSVKQDLGRLLNGWRRHEEHSSVDAYLWKIQYGLESGHHVHLTALLNGKVMGDANGWVLGVESLWKKIAGGSAALRIYNDETDGVLGGGAGRWTEENRLVKRARLIESWSYLLQKDIYFRVKVGRRKRVFGKSELRRTAPRVLPGDGRLITVRRARRMLVSLRRTQGSGRIAAKEANLAYTVGLQKVFVRWKRLGLDTGIDPQDFSDDELKKLLFDHSRGKFCELDFAAIFEKARSGAPLYPLWLEHFRTAAGRPHYPGTFLKALKKWSGGSREFKVRHVDEHRVNVQKDVLDIPRLRRPGAKLELIWDPFLSASTRGRGH